MNKGQGATVGAILLAGAMFRTGTTPVPTPSEASKPSVTEAAATRPATGEGPWLASCKYWASGRWSEPSAKVKSPELHVTFDQTGAKTDAHVTASTESPKLDCGGNGWGIPSSEPGHELDIRTIIATVPDPIHSHLALDFDRAIDSLLLAAADNRYLGSYYWLPWRSRSPSLATSESTASPQIEQDNNRENQPGLIVLRYAPSPGDDRLSWSSYHRVIYLFLVAETPALGVNGIQLQNAFKAEALLQTPSAKLEMLPSPSRPKVQNSQPEEQLSIIGPIFSGSAASLHEGIKTARLYSKPSKVVITGVTGTEIAARELDSEGDIYRSFGENAKFEEERFLDLLSQSGYDRSRVAILSEDGSVFGKAQSDPKQHSKKDTTLALSFPRELSLLRNAQADQPLKSSTEASAPPSPYLNLSLKDYTADDTVPHFSTQSPLSLEAQLMALAHQLQRAGTQFIFISASNILDDIFLAQFLHRACPDARIVLFNGGDLLFERDVENAPYIGSISISPHLLTSLRYSDDVQRLYSDSQAVSIYNAATYTFWNHKEGSFPRLTGYQAYPDSKHAAFLQIPLWATVIGADGYYPLGILDWCASNLGQILPTIKAGQLGDQKCAEPDTGKPAEKKSVPESIGRNSGISPSLSWIMLDTLIIVICLLHGALLWSAQYWSPLTRDLAVRQNDQPHRRSIYLNIGTAVLVAMAFVTAYPLLRVGHFYRLAPSSYLLVWSTLFAGLLALISTLFKTWP